jgi:hypothetical protein
MKVYDGAADNAIGFVTFHNVSSSTPGRGRKNASDRNFQFLFAQMCSKIGSFPYMFQEFPEKEANDGLFSAHVCKEDLCVSFVQQLHISEKSCIMAV